MNESVSESFRREYPQHADKVSQMVHKWYQFAVNGYLVRRPDILRIATANFIQTAQNYPENILINGVPLVFALESKQKSMLDQFKRIPPATYRDRFATWFNTNLTNDINPGKRIAIEQVATEHTFQWLGNLPIDFKQGHGVWDLVDNNLLNFSNHKTSRLHPVSIKLFEHIQLAVLEQFMTDVYAPRGLFGGELVN